MCIYIYIYSYHMHTYIYIYIYIYISYIHILWLCVHKPVNPVVPMVTFSPRLWRITNHA